ncbi:hypothetical protein LEP1GSC056_3873 [Leptospira borgpetersenii str. Brem 328]|nr:hypothetical protein LEP1GSC056_3873 [Leptospira borgpetersenii str. Brem 328]
MWRQKREQNRNAFRVTEDRRTSLTLVLDRGQKETGKMIHHGFKMQFVETKKRTKSKCFSKKSILLSVVCHPSFLFQNSAIITLLFFSIKANS